MAQGMGVVDRLGLAQVGAMAEGGDRGGIVERQEIAGRGQCDDPGQRPGVEPFASIQRRSRARASAL
jgi:hypothetical protein